MSKIAPPNYTQIPNIILDEYLAVMTGSELKVTLAVARQTFGWHRKRVRLSLSALERATGLTRQSVKNGVDAGLERGTLARFKRGSSYEYSVNVGVDVSQVEEETSLKIRPATSLKIRPKVVKKLDHLKENKEIQNDDDDESTNYWTQPRQPLTRKAGRKYPAEEGTTDASAILVSHMQSLIEQPNGLLRKYKEAAGVSELGASDIATITAWIDHYQAKEAAGMEHTLACKLAYGAIRDANPAPVQTEPATVADKLLEQATQVASAWDSFLQNPSSILENKRQPRRRETDEENHFAV